MDEWLRTDEERQQQAAQEERVNRAAIERRAALREVMGTKRGRSVVWRLINGWSPELVGLYSASWHQDTSVMSRLEGHREVAIRVMQDAQRASRELFWQMLQEQDRADMMSELVSSAPTTKPT